MNMLCFLLLNTDLYKLPKLCFHHFARKVSMGIFFPAALPYPVHLIKERVEDMVGRLTSVFSWLTAKNLSLPVPVEKKRIVECRPWQSFPHVLMVGLSWEASFTADRKADNSERVFWEQKVRSLLTEVQANVGLLPNDSMHKDFWSHDDRQGM